jgi:hypothetical protein
MMRRCVRLLVVIMLLIVFPIPWLFLRPEQKPCSRGRWPRQHYLLGTTLSRGRRPRLQRMEFLQKRFATRRQPFFEPFRTIAIGTRPGLGPVFMTTIAPRMRVFHRQEIKIFFPIGTLFLKRGITKASFYPMRLALGIHARHLHVVQVLVARD